MPLSIRIISNPSNESVTQWNHAFPEEGGNIGRAYGAILQLSDASREVSGIHAIIRKTSRGYQIADNSTNGLFINGFDMPLGKGNQTTLSDGDALDIGGYRLLVSCFLPDHAKVRSGEECLNSSSFGEDPFSRQPEPSVETISEVQTEPDCTMATRDIVDDDPFLSAGTMKKMKQEHFELDFPTSDEDPLRCNELQASLNLRNEAMFSSFVQQDISATPKSAQLAMVEIQKHEQFLQECSDKALEIALTRLLSELSPDAIESMFNDLSGSRFWPRKRKYWCMYKRYFTRQIENRDWQVKFKTYFHDAIRLQRNLEEGR